jgi:hypothetical protein
MKPHAAESAAPLFRQFFRGKSQYSAREPGNFTLAAWRGQELALCAHNRIFIVTKDLSSFPHKSRVGKFFPAR